MKKHPAKTAPSGESRKGSKAPHREAEGHLSREKKQLLGLFDGIDDVIYVADTETYELLYVNEAFERNWGEDVVGRKCYKVLQDRDTPCPFCTNDKILGAYRGRSYVWEFQNEVTGRWFRCSDKAIRWDDGRWVRFELASDITERKTADAHIEALNEAMLGREKRIIDIKREVNGLCRELGRDPIYELDADHAAARASSVGTEPDNRSVRAGASLAPRRLFHVETLQKALQIFCETVGIAAAVIDLKGDVIAQARWQRICTDFHRVNEETCKRCIESDTELANRLGAGQKTTVYRCRNGLTDAASPIVIDGQHVANAFVGQFLLAKPDVAWFHAQAQRFGFDEDEYLKALRTVPVVAQERLPAMLEMLTGLAELSVSMGKERLLTHELTASLEERQKQLQTQQQVALSLMQDARREEQRARAALAETDRLNEELIRSNKELEQFAYVASHDLQEPLRMVASYTQLLGQRYEGRLDQKADKYIRYAVDGARRMQGLINDLLAFSRVGRRGKPLQPAACRDVLDEVLRGMEQAVKESDAEIVVRDLPSVMADRVQLGQVLQNLIANAIKFRGEQRPRIEISAKRNGSRWAISVADNGIGIEPQFHERIFTIFQRLHERGTYSGSGIGLSIVKKIVERHGGDIRIDSQKGQGACFTFTMPMVEEAEESEAHG